VAINKSNRKKRVRSWALALLCWAKAQLQTFLYMTIIVGWALPKYVKIHYIILSNAHLTLKIHVKNLQIKENPCGIKIN
jgi:hypothetical protein